MSCDLEMSYITLDPDDVVDLMMNLKIRIYDLNDFI